MRTQPFSDKYAKGISLIEVLVTTLILGVGLLGVAALQISSISGNQEGLFTSQATSIAEDFASRIRSSKIMTFMPNSLIEYQDFVNTYHNGDTEALTCDVAPAAMCRSNDNNAAVDCSIADLANFDKWEVCSLARDTLPQGKVRVINNTIRLTIVVDWDSTSARQDIGNQAIVNSNCANLTTSATRNCIIMELVP